MRFRPVRDLIHAVTAAALIVSFPGTSYAQRGTFSADLGANAGYSTNPFLLRNADGSGFVEISLIPRYTIATETAQTVFEGRYRRTQYLNDYGDSTGYGATLRHAQQLNERLSITAQAGFDSSVQGERGLLFLPFDEVPLGPPGLEDDFGFDPDTSLLGLRQRRNSYQASASANFKKSESENFFFSGNVSRATFPGVGPAFNSWSYGGAAGYSRALTPLTTVGGQLGVQRIQYDGSAGSYTIYSPQATYRTQLTPLWSIDAALGVSVVRGDFASQSVNSVGLSGEVTGCRQGSVSQACFGLAQDTGATGLGGVRRTQRAFADYTYRLNEDDRVLLGASFVRYGGGVGLGSSELVSADAGYEKRFGDRLLGNAGIFVRHGSTGFSGTATDVGGQVGLKYRFGRVR